MIASQYLNESELTMLVTRNKKPNNACHAKNCPTLRTQHTRINNTDLKAAWAAQCCTGQQADQALQYSPTVHHEVCSQLH
jgi:hypothetical protein